MDDYTPAVERALKLARYVAACRGAQAVEPADLLRALLQEQEGRPFLLLIQAGGDVTALQQWTSATTTLSESETPELSLDPAMAAALCEARTLARDIALEPTVNSEQVLVTLLGQEESLRREMQSLGVSIDKLQDLVLAANQGPSIALDVPLHLEDGSESMDIARILDAAANRAREALRVVEDFCRFVLDDALLTRELKTLRHDLAGILEALPAPLLAARETQFDVGTQISTEQERSRESLDAVVQANLKRLQEALRSLEEYAKLSDSSAGQALERMRYQTYTLERMVLLGEAARSRLADVRLCVLATGAQCWGNFKWTVREAVAGGAQMIQLREKEVGNRELWQRAKQVRAWTRDAGALFIMNDRPDIARMVRADGVHLGQDDAPVKEARRILGPDAIIGVSTHNLDQVRQAVRDGASYVGVGPTFPSQTKDFEELAGLDFVRQAVAETSLPAFVIGGITLANLPQVLAAGARRVAVSAAVCGSETPQAIARALRQLLDAAG
jgi:thiamine-phosphate pyrophosphorylase